MIILNLKILETVKFSEMSSEGAPRRDATDSEMTVGSVKEHVPTTRRGPLREA